MKRNVTFEEISDGKRYGADDLVKIGTNGCKNCSECCKNTEDTIFLDPYDIYCLEAATGKDFTSLLDRVVELIVSEGLIIPVLKKENGACVFLEGGRCRIHKDRPGFCRLFPLGRIWNDDASFDYFLQIHECAHIGNGEIAVKEWLGIDNIKEYEAFIRSWHLITADIKEMAQEPELAADLKAANMGLLNEYFVKPYDTHEPFFTQFYSRGI